MQSYAKIILILSFLYIISCGDNQIQSPGVTTKFRLNRIYDTMIEIEKDNKVTIGAQLKNISDKTNLIEKLAIFLSLQPGAESFSKEYFIKDFCRDGYGREFRIAFKTDLNPIKASGLIAITNLDVVIWSTGKNGMDELGLGDDITYIAQGDGQIIHQQESARGQTDY